MKINQEKLNNKAGELGIELIILFGSRANNTATDQSDYDIAVLMLPNKNLSNLNTYTSVLFFLSEVLQIPEDKIDLTNLNDANPLLAYHVFFNGKLLYGDKLTFLEEKAVSYREYIDAEKLFKLEEKIIYKHQRQLRNALNKI